jgi:hypothetical protein
MTWMVSHVGQPGQVSKMHPFASDESWIASTNDFRISDASFSLCRNLRRELWDKHDVLRHDSDQLLTIGEIATVCVQDIN